MVQSYSPGGANVASHVGILVPPGEYDWTCASFGPPESTPQTANRSVQPFLHSARQKVPIFNNGRPFPRKLPILMGDLNLHLIYDSLGQSEPTIQTPLSFSYVRLSNFCTGDLESPYKLTLQWAVPSPKIALPMGVSGPHLTHDSLGPSMSIIQMASRSSLPFLHRWPQSVPMLYNGTPLSPPQNCPFSWGDLDAHLIHSSLGSA